MYWYRTLIIICILLLFVGCGKKPNMESTSNIDIQFTNVKTTEALAQEKANTAKRTLSQHDHINTVKAVNSEKDLVIAFEIDHLKRFNLEKIRKRIQKEMDEKFPDLNVIVSTDQKIVLELDRLEEKIHSDSISKKELNKKLKKIVKLDKEQT